MPVAASVNIAVCGKFHMLNYLPALASKKIVNRFYMSHKPSTVAEMGLSSDIVRNYPSKEYLLRGYGRVFKNFGYENAILAFHKLWQAQVILDWACAEHWHLLAQGAGVRIASRARAEGSRLLCEVVNTHPVHRLEVMQAEAVRWGLRPLRTSLLRREELILEEVALGHALLAPSEHVARTFRDRGIAVPIHVLPYAANVDRFIPIPGQRRAEPSMPLRIISVGQIGLRKGQLHLLEAISRLSIEVEVTLVGAIDQEVLPLLQHHQERFRHIPRVSPLEMPKILSEHDIFVSSSLEEGLAVSICEAMAMGLVVIATHESGASEVLNDDEHGLLFSATDQEALACAIARLDFDREALARLGDAAYAQTHSLVNWQRYADELEEIYGKL